MICHYNNFVNPNIIKFLILFLVSINYLLKLYYVYLGNMVLIKLKLVSIKCYYEEYKESKEKV